jgi:hypothetical protein
LREKCQFSTGPTRDITNKRGENMIIKCVNCKFWEEFDDELGVCLNPKTDEEYTDTTAGCSLGEEHD